MKNIQILATRPYRHPFPIISWLIRLLEWSKQSHVSIYFPDREIVRHAHFNNIKEQDIKVFMLTNKLVNTRTLDLDDTQYDKISEYTKSKLGKQTGYFSTLFGGAIPLIMRNLFNLKLRNPFFKGLTCSEFTREALRQIDERSVLILTNDISKGNFTTDDALELASELSIK